MTEPGPLAQPAAWNNAAAGYTIEIEPLLAHFARDALELAQLAPGTRVLDVAAGPGTLSLQAAARAERVVAVDFSADMLDILRQRAAEAGFDHVETRVADGQALPFADAAFDAAFSMFGLMFFPDRAAGFDELRRVLVPGGRAVVSSWIPAERIPLLGALYEILASLLPELPFGDGEQPLADPETFRAEMTAAGFESVAVHTVAHRLEQPSVADFWQSQTHGSAPILLLQEHMDEAQRADLGQQVVARLEQRFGTGPLQVDWSAHLAVGATPTGR